jgi:hypothetical protein
MSSFHRASGFAVKWRSSRARACLPDLDHINVPREINADAAKRLATEKHTPMMHGGVLE